eukprot:8767679-Pyramimonas_sp.AAC.1
MLIIRLTEARGVPCRAASQARTGQVLRLGAAVALLSASRTYLARAHTELVVPALGLATSVGALLVHFHREP